MKSLDVIALGGNAILPATSAGTIYEQFSITRATMRGIAELVCRGRHVVVTHGNGPIVGNIVLRNEAARDTIPPMPLGICVADSQGGIGYMIQQVLRNALAAAGVPREVVTLVTQVRISPDDPSLESPSKPIGPYYTREEAHAIARDEGWQVVEDSKRGWRRVVPSPQPLSIVEIDIVRNLVESGCVVVTVGGGGIPVVETEVGLNGVEAVVDKDLASTVLAADLGAERMIVVTSVDAVYRDYGTPQAEAIREMTADEAESLAGVLPAGSMRPKLGAAASFARSGGETVIAEPEGLVAAVDGKAGTRVLGDKR